MDHLKTSKKLNIMLWIAQGFLALTFIWAGTMKLFNPAELPFLWARENPTLVLLTGILDVLAGIGIIFPMLLRPQTKLSILTAYGIIALMVAAGIFHILRGEVKDIGFNIFMTLLAIFIAWDRQFYRSTEH